MEIYEVIIEYFAASLDRPFTYRCSKKEHIPLFCRVMVPFRNKPVCGMIVGVINEEETPEEYEKRTGFALKEIEQVVDEEPLITDSLNLLANEIAKAYFSPLISVYFAMLPPSLRPSLSSQKQPKIAYENWIKPVINANYDNLTTAQAEVLYHLIQEGEKKKSELSPSIVRSLITKGKVITYEKKKERLVLDEVEQKEDLELNEEQTNAFNKIFSSEKQIFLLQGVTGSGKTEIYLQSARKVIQEGKQVLVLVPEISLTFPMIQRFLSRFKRIAVLHSELTAGQRYDEYLKMKNQEVDIVIGTRSAIFAPLEKIGLCIIDEEHSESYKQEDLPFYHAVDVAKMRQKREGFRLILGSATPTLESESRALKGVYEHLILKNRVLNLPLPEVEIVDMSDRKNLSNDSMMISTPLIKAIEQRLKNKEQTILLLNRRGYSPFVSCRKCGHVMKCPECDVALTYHYDTNQLICHHCGYTTYMMNTCPKCKSNQLFKAGFGSEKVEQEISRLFPDASIVRLDSDVAKKKGAIQKGLEKFRSGKSDILIGTQMVAKGFDFPNVTLVGIVLADIGLAIPSFRASERTFDMITQAIGRSGRKKRGQAIIQTYQKNHYVVQTSAAQDYMKFYAIEMKYRKMLQNPPYTYMALLLISGSNEDDVIDASYEIKKYLISQQSIHAFTFLGPSELFVKKYQQKHRRKIVIKYKDFEEARPVLESIRLFFIKKTALNLSININPSQDY